MTEKEREAMKAAMDVPYHCSDQHITGYELGFAEGWKAHAEYKPEVNGMGLVPCPFCGGEAVKVRCCGKACSGEGYCPRCSNLFGCNPCDVWCDTPDAWNRRS